MRYLLDVWGGCWLDHQADIENGEVGLSQALLADGYNIASMQHEYAGLDFRRQPDRLQCKGPWPGSNPTFCCDVPGQPLLTAPSVLADCSHTAYSMCLLTVPTHCAYSQCLLTMPTHCAYSLCLLTVPAHCAYVPAHCACSLCLLCLLSVDCTYCTLSLCPLKVPTHCAHSMNLHTVPIDCTAA